MNNYDFLNKNQKKIKISNKHKTTQYSQFNNSSIIEEFQSINKEWIGKDGYKDIIGTSNPYLFNLFSDLIVNPSTVSISEFQKMTYTNPLIASQLSTLSNLIINRFGHYTHKNKEYNNFINNMFINMVRPINDILSEMLNALWAGFSIGEKRYTSDGRYITIIDIEPRPAQSFIFRVDSQGHLKDDGIIQYYFNNMYTGYGNMLSFNNIENGMNTPNPYASRGDLPYPYRTVFAQPIGTIVIPKDKCVHFAYKGLDGGSSPYGRSLLRSIYNEYLISTELNRILLNAANTASTPIPVVVVEPNSTNNDNGDSVLTEISQQLSELSNPGGANFLLLSGQLNKNIWIDKLNTTVNLDHLVVLKNYFDKIMLTGLFTTSDLAGTSEIGSYARAETQQSTLNRNIASLTNSLQDVFLRQVIKPLLEINFDEHHDFGSFIETEDMTRDVNLNIRKINTLNEHGIKLKPEAIMDLMDLKYDMVDKIIDTITQQDNTKLDNEKTNKIKTTKDNK